MKRVLAIITALALCFALGCSASKQSAAAATPTAAPTATPVPTPTPEPTPTPTPAPPEGVSSQPFDFIENTFALWRIVRHEPVDGMVQCDYQLLALTKTIYCNVTIENNEATRVHPSYTFELIQPNGDTLASSDSSIHETAAIDDFASSFQASSEFAQALYVLTYTFEIPEQDSLPVSAKLSFPRENAYATIDFGNPIVVDVAS